MPVGLHWAALLDGAGLAQDCGLGLNGGLVKGPDELRGGTDPLFICGDGIEVGGGMR